MLTFLTLLWLKYNTLYIHICVKHFGMANIRLSLVQVSVFFIIFAHTSPQYHPGFSFLYKHFMCCATNQVTGLIPAGVIGIFYSHKILPIALRPWGRLSL